MGREPMGKGGEREGANGKGKDIREGAKVVSGKGRRGNE